MPWLCSLLQGVADATAAVVAAAEAAVAAAVPGCRSTPVGAPVSAGGLRAVVALSVFEFEVSGGGVQQAAPSGVILELVAHHRG